MRALDAIMGDAREGSPFSNSTSGEMWMGDWCYRCTVDAPFQRDEAPEGCPLIMVALLDKTPAEWTETAPQVYTCSEFVEDTGGDPDTHEDSTVLPRWPQPAQPMPGQLDIFGQEN
jgi:hypothetical protein